MMAARSKHPPGGVNVIFCDGHTDFVSNNIHIAIWRALSTSQGEEVLGDYDQ
jgi:prepilin-type processing-associated H-X9-DG protein